MKEKERLLKIKAIIKKKKPSFKRPWYFKLKRLGESWRKPKGLDHKYRLKKKGYEANVQVGYRTPKKVRGHHPSGYIEKLIHNPKEIDNINPKTDAIRIAHTVGKRKRMEIIRKAKEKGIKILNPTETLMEIEET